MDLYREIILDHYKNPRNFGHIEAPSASAEAYNATCGDRIVMELRVNKKRIIEEVRFSGVGCAISQAAASLLTEKVLGLTASRVLQMKSQDMLSLVGTTLTPSRVKCATLPLEVLHKAILSLK